MVGRSVSLVALLTLSLAVALAGRGARAQESGWFDAGSGLVGDDGRLYISAALPFNLIDAGLTYARVTSGPCDGSPEDYVVYEVALSPEGNSGGVYVGVLEPIGRLATPLIQPAGAYDVFLFARGDTSGFTAAADGLTPSVTFQACFRAP
jgi:hypothetical protein